VREFVAAVDRTLRGGAAIGLPWGTSLRAWMANLVLELGGLPAYSWTGTFLSTLPPAAVVGALIGVDWQRSRSSRSRVPWSCCRRCS